jgi:hypothetical protein
MKHLVICMDHAKCLPSHNFISFFMKFNLHLNIDPAGVCILVSNSCFTILLYNFNQFISHMSQLILADNGNNLFSILAVFGDLSDK